MPKNPEQSIRLATHHDLPAVMAIVAETVAEMKTIGNDQWDETYPLADRFQTDIKNNALYVATQDNHTIAFITIDEDQAQEYAAIPWQGTDPLVIHRVAVSLANRAQGTASSLINFARNQAKSLNKKSIRVDTHSSNTRMQAFLKKHGFTKAGEMDYHKKSRPFHCFEHILL